MPSAIGLAEPMSDDEMTSSWEQAKIRTRSMPSAAGNWERKLEIAADLIAPSAVGRRDRKAIRREKRPRRLVRLLLSKPDMLLAR